MKKILLTLSALVLCINSFGQEDANITIPHVKVNIDTNRTWSNDKGTLIKDGTEYHLFTKDTVVYVQTTTNYIAYPKDASLFYKSKEFKHNKLDPAGNIPHTIPRTDFCLSIAQGFQNARYKFENEQYHNSTYFFIHRPEAYCLTIDKDNLVVNSLSVSINETLNLADSDTYQLRICKHAYSLISEVLVNNISIYKNEYDIAESLINGIFLDTTPIDLTVTPDNLNDKNNTIQVRYLSLNENGELTEDKVAEYVLSIDKSLPKELIWAGIGFLALLIAVVIGVFFHHRKNKKEAAKTKEGNTEGTQESETDRNKDQINNKNETVKVAKSSSSNIEGVEDDNRADTIEKLENRIKELETALANQKEIENQLNEENTRHRQTKDQYTKFIKDLQSLLTLSGTDTTTSMETIKDAISSLKKDLDNKSRNCHDLQTQLEGIEEKHQSELTDQNNKYQKKLAENEKEHEEATAALTETYKKQLEGKNSEIESYKKLIEANCGQIKEFYCNGINKSGNTISILDKHIDKDSASNNLFDYIMNSSNGFTKFSEDCDTMIKTDMDMKNLQQDLKQRLLQDLNYDLSWCNSLARLYAYSKVNELNDIFGYYKNYKREIATAWDALIMMANRLGVDDLTLPELFADSYDEDKYDYSNINLVLPILFPDYYNLLKPKVIYDILTVGYRTSDGPVKPCVAY